ncbi:MAG: protein kinase domain-containing protein [Planctomycetaceae bacterium]
MSKTSCSSCGFEFQHVAAGDPDHAPQAAQTCPRCGAGVALFSADTLVTTRKLVHRDVDSGDVRIAGYELVDVLGRGGMGVVYEGRQISLGRRVAIKFLMPTLADSPEFVERFQREAAVLARVSHPNVVTIYERGTTGAGVYFIMEYVEGPGGGAPVDLRSVLRSRRLSEDEVLRLGVQIVRALGFAHQMGIVHRDVKPGNVMLDRHGHAKVGDFGIALLESELTDSELTGAGQPLGTLDYMAPEQRLNSSLVDARADVYSVGVMLYEMLTGILPRGAWLRPSAVLATLNPRWDELLEQMLHTDVQQRVKDLQLVAEQLEAMQIQSLRPVAAGADSDAATVLQPPRDVPAELSCADCGAAVKADVRFCPVCRLSQWMECPGCQLQLHSSSRFCTACGTGIHSFRMQQKYSAEARKSLALARDQGQSLADRCLHAQQAGLAAARAVKHADENPEPAALLQSINQYQIGLLRQAVSDAVTARSLGEACGLLEQIRQIAAADAEAESQLAALRRYLNDRLVRAERLFSRGRFEGAIRVLEKLVRQFPEESGVRERLESCVRRRRETEEVVYRLIPQLQEQKRWYAVRRELIELRRSGIQIGGLSESWALVRQEFAAIEQDLQAARSALAGKRIREARQRTDKVLYHVADHPVALRIVDSIQAVDRQAQELNQRLRNSVSSADLFSAAAAVSSADRLVRSLLLEDLLRRLKRACQRADNYLRLLIWLVTGFVVLFPVFWIQQTLLRGIEGFLPAAEDGMETWWVGALQHGSAQGLFVVTAMVALAAVRVAVRRSVSLAGLATWAVLGLEGIGTYHFCRLMVTDLIPVTGVAECLARLSIGVAAGAVFGVASQDLVNPVRGRFLRGAFSGLLAAGLLELSQWSVVDYSRFVLPGLWLGGLLFMGGWIRRLRGVAGVLFGSGLSGVLVAGMTRQDVAWTEFQKDLSGTLLLALCAVLVSQTRRIRFMLSVSLLSWVLVRVCAELTETGCVLSMWLMLNLALFADRQRDLDFRLFLRDRLRARKISGVPAVQAAGGRQRRV